MKNSRCITFLKTYKELIVVIIIAIGFFIFSSSLNYLSQTPDFIKWLSPDETANYTMAKTFATTGNLQFFEKYNLISKDIIHPRSFRSDGGWIKPVSFLGLPLIYGALAHLFGVPILPYLTPLFGALGIIYFYFFLKELFNKQTAFISALLLAVFPVYIYFSARSFFHNILFIVCLLIGLYYSLIMLKKKDSTSSYFQTKVLPPLYALIAGLSFGAAIITRTSELLWLGPLLFGLYIVNCHKINVLKLFLLLLGLIIAFSPVIYWNQILYGSWYASGYPELNSSLGTLTASGGALAETTVMGNFTALKPLLLKIKTIVFHFGFNLQQSLKMFDKYVLTMFPWLAWITTAGGLLFLLRFKKYTRNRWLYVVAWGVVSMILVIYYGSWVFYDNPDPKSFTIGNSYTRYWLPLYLGAISLSGLAITTISAWLRKPMFVFAVRFLAVGIITIISIQFVWFDESEGIKISIEKQVAAKQEWQTVLTLTEPRAVIITRYHDKLFFPERKVVLGLFDDKNMITEYAHIASYVPVYYYNFSFTEKDINYLNSGPLAEVGMRLRIIQKITDRFTLYRLEPTTQIIQQI